MKPLVWIVLFGAVFKISRCWTLEDSMTNHIRASRSGRLEMIKNITFLLESLLKGYDNKIRPNMNSSDERNLCHSAEVMIDIDIRSMGPISEADMSYSMDCYFRQTWKDSRLRFTSATHKTLVLGISMLDKLWKPDTYFWNGKHSYLHKLTTPNKFVRINQDGTVFFSSSKMWNGFTQLSTGYAKLSPCDWELWKPAVKPMKPVTAAKELQMSQFELKDITVENGTMQNRGMDYSALEVHFMLQRHMGYFLINFYAPSTLIVVLSWVAFLINREATADRIALGFTCVLTMTFIALDSRSDLPRVTYPTALDIYILLCYFFLFICIVEFAVVHSFTKFSTGDPEMKVFERQRVQKIPRHMLVSHSLRRHQFIPRETESAATGNGGVRVVPKDSPTSPPKGAYKRKRGSSEKGSERVGLLVPSGCNSPGLDDPRRRRSSVAAKLYYNWLHIGKKTDPLDTEVNSISKIDRVARLVFPMGFCLASFVYWRTYLSTVNF